MQQPTTTRPCGLFTRGLLILFFSTAGLSAQEAVTGSVTDANGIPLMGVNVLQESTGNGTVTDFDGNFSLNLESESTLIFSYLGFVTQKLAAAPGQQRDIVLQQDSGGVKEVVIMGDGSQTRKTVTSNVSSVNADEIAKVPVAGTDQLLQGKASGVMISNNSGDPGAGVFVRIRGTSSI